MQAREARRLPNLRLQNRKSMAYAQHSTIKFTGAIKFWVSVQGPIPITSDSSFFFNLLSGDPSRAPSRHVRKSPHRYPFYHDCYRDT